MDKLLKKVKDMDPEERKKLQKLLTVDKKDEKNMGWMYKGDEPEREEYLLGRRIDKHIEEEGKVEEDKDAPGASFQDVIARRADLDMHAKMREDPLYAIRQREEEARKKLLQNPIKMKQLEKLMKEREKKLKKDKKKKKKKKHKRSTDSEDSDDEIVNKYLAILEQKNIKSQTKDRGRDRSDHQGDDTARLTEHSGDERVIHSSHRAPSDDRSRGRKDHHRRHPVSDHVGDHRKYSSGDEQPKSYGLLVRGEDQVRRNRSRSREKSRERSHRSPKQHRSRSHDRSRSPQRNKASKDSGKYSRRQSRSPPRQEPKRKLSSAEMERRRAEMLENAKHHDGQREQKVKRYREEEKREKQALDKQGATAEFLNPMMMKHAEKSTIEERIKRNMYHVQRTRSDLDKNFAKR